MGGVEGAVLDGNSVVIPNVLVPMPEYNKMREALKKLEALEAAGVDNWEWYDAAMSDYFLSGLGV